MLYHIQLDPWPIWEPDEGQCGNHGRADREEPGLSFVHGVTTALDADAGPVGDGDVGRVSDACSHHCKYYIAEYSDALVRSHGRGLIVLYSG